MVLTSEDVYFAKPDSDLVVDRIPLRCVTVISKVDRAQDALSEQSAQGRIGFSPSERNFKKPSKRRNSVKFSTSLKMDSMVDLQEGMRETFAFEIRVSNSTSPDDDAQTTNIRSYFTRVDTSELCDEWINEIKSAVKRVKTMRSERSSAIPRMQAKAKSVADSTAWRCTVALAIFVNFISSVVEAEYLPGPQSTMGVLLDGIDYVLDVFFGFELLVIAFANWRTLWGSPFVDSAWNW